MHLSDSMSMTNNPDIVTPTLHNFEFGSQQPQKSFASNTKDRRTSNIDAHTLQL